MHQPTWQFVLLAVLGVGAYPLGIIVFVAGQLAGSEMFGYLTPRAYDSLNFFWVIIGSLGAIPGLGTTIIFLVVSWLLQRVLQWSPHPGLIAQGLALLVALVLTFLAGVLITYYFITLMV